MEVELLVRYRVVMNVRDVAKAAGAMQVAEYALKAKLPRGAYDVHVEALHCPPVTACPTRRRHALEA